MEGEMQRQTGQTTTESMVKQKERNTIILKNRIIVFFTTALILYQSENIMTVWSSYAGAMTQPLKNTEL